MTEVILGGLERAFAQGGNRLCFIDPRDSNRIIKVLRPDRSADIKRAKQSFPRNLKPLRYFDENWQEQRVYQKIQAAVGDAAYDLIPRCYGLVATDCGPGLVTEMIKDDDGRVSLSLKQCIWQQGKARSLMAVVEDFVQRWGELGVPSRNLLLHNIVVQQSADGPTRLVVIDGLGWADIVPLAYRCPRLARWKAQRKAQRLPQAIDQLLEKQRTGQDWGYHGWLDEEQRIVAAGSSAASQTDR